MYLLHILLIVAVCLSLWVLQTLSAPCYHADLDVIVSVENGTESVELPCGDIPSDCTWWFMDSSNGWKLIFDHDHKKMNQTPRYYNGYSADKYETGKTADTNLVIQNIEPSDSHLFRCIAKTGGLGYSNTIMLQVKGK